MEVPAAAVAADADPPPPLAVDEDVDNLLAFMGEQLRLLTVVIGARSGDGEMETSRSLELLVISVIVTNNPVEMPNEESIKISSITSPLLLLLLLLLLVLLFSLKLERSSSVDSSLLLFLFLRRNIGEVSGEVNGEGV